MSYPATEGSTAALGIVYTLGSCPFLGLVPSTSIAPPSNPPALPDPPTLDGSLSTIYIDGGAQSEGTMVTGTQGYGIVTGYIDDHTGAQADGVCSKVGNHLVGVGEADHRV